MLGGVQEQFVHVECLFELLRLELQIPIKDIPTPYLL